MRVIFLALTIAWPGFAVGQTQQKPAASQPTTGRRKVSPSRKPAKAPELKVALVGRVENKQEPAVEGVDFGSPRRTAQGVAITVGNCGWMSLTSCTVARVHLAITEARDGDGKTIPGLNGQSLRIVCENADEVSRFLGKEVLVRGVIREGTRLEGKEIGVVSVSEVPRPDPATPMDLFSSAASGDLEGVRRALQGGVNVNARTEFGTIPVGTTRFPTGSYTSLIGVNGGETALILAAREGHVEIVRFLLEKGAAVSAADGKGETAADGARKGDHKEILQMLSQAGGANPH